MMGEIMRHYDIKQRVPQWPTLRWRVNDGAKNFWASMAVTILSAYFKAICTFAVGLIIQ